jgi:hypothetical protein
MEMSPIPVKGCNIYALVPVRNIEAESARKIDGIRLVLRKKATFTGGIEQ